MKGVDEHRDASLDLLTELAQPSPLDVALDWTADVSMVAFALAPQVRSLEAAGEHDEMHDEGRRLAAQLRLSNLSFTRVDPLSLPYPEDTFSLAVSSDGLQLSPDPVRALRELGRVVRADGRVVVVGPVVDAVTDDAFNELARLRTPGHRRCHEAQRLEAMAAEAGFAVERRTSARCTVDLEYWLQTGAVPAARASLARECFKRMPVDVQARMDVVFDDQTISFSYEVCGLRLTRS